MAPRMSTGESLQFLIALNRVSRQLFLGNQLSVLEILRDLADKTDTLDNRRDVLAAIVGTFVEVVEVDHRRIARIGGAQRNTARAIVCMGLEHNPRQIIQVL